LEGAFAEASAKRSGSAAGSPVASSSAARAPLAPDAATAGAARSADVEPLDEDPRSRKKWIAAAVIAAAVIAAGAVAFSMRSRAPAAHVPASPATAAAPHTPPAPAPVKEEAEQVPLVAGTLDSLLEKARSAMRQRRYTEPANDCALLYYRSALKVDPTSGEARDGMTRLAGLLNSRFKEAMSAGRYDQATEAIADLRIAAPGAAGLAAMQSRLLQAEIRTAITGSDVARATALVHEAQQSHAASPSQLAAWRAALAHDASAARTAHLADLFNQRIRAGRLAAPANDSAQYYLQELTTLAPHDPATESGARTLVAAFLAKARDAALAGHSSDADKWIADARGAGMTGGELSSYQRGIAAARAKAASADAGRLAALARARIQSGALTGPADDSAAYYLTQLEGVTGGKSAAHAIGLELASSLIARATAAAKSGQAAAMRSDLAVARQWGADPVLVAAVEQILAGPPKASAQAQRAAGSRIPAGYVPTRTRYVAPQYPEAALDARVSGSVTVEFTVDLDGRPRHVRVIKSKPRGVFDYAATSAVSRWRFAPPIINNVPTEIPTRTVIRFKAPK
ncbi:MAG: energy transducer TonB, partial [Steroidobacteraceae bacterium]